MERWSAEETLHGELLNRFLAEAGFSSDEKWQDDVRNAVSRVYRFNSRMTTILTNLVGRKFTATHMTFGAIHEMSTTQGYRRLMKLADQPRAHTDLEWDHPRRIGSYKILFQRRAYRARRESACPKDREEGHRSFLAARRARIVAKGEDPLCHLDAF
jgi:hypothetical protein